jgi:hypothetical protein
MQMDPKTPKRASTAPRVPVGKATELPLSELTAEEYDSLFGPEYEPTVPAELEVA